MPDPNATGSESSHQDDAANQQAGGQENASQPDKPDAEAQDKAPQKKQKPREPAEEAERQEEDRRTRIAGIGMPMQYRCQNDKMVKMNRGSEFCAAQVTRVHEDGSVNLKVHLDGNPGFDLERVKVADVKHIADAALGECIPAPFV